MSTRRARIKAVTALPPRRKNTENSDNSKSKTEPSKIDVEKPKSPRTPKLNKQQSSESVLSPPRITTPLNVVNLLTEPTVQTIAETRVTTPAKHINPNISTPEIAAKVSVITSASSLKSIFLSPQVRNSPQRKAQSTPKPHPDKITIRNINITPDQNKQPNKVSGDNLGTANSTTADKDDYNVHSVPESVTEDTVMDGIIPLQTARSAPKPIDLLKNEIISENAEVLFDPIVPLPSPSKVRPKLRPVPRLGPLRRNSVQGSASESEDENRRALLAATPTAARQRNDSHTSQNTIHMHLNKEVNRVRNDSVCSSMSQVTAQPATVGSPVKEKHYTKSRRQDISRRTAAMRRRREAVKPDKLTMYDLIFYNPTTKPIMPDQEEIKAKEASELYEKMIEKKKEENVDDPPTKETVAVPQMKLGPNGEIVLDEQSLVVKNTAATRQVSSVVREGAWTNTGGYYRRPPRTADWSDEETVRFYRALAGLGTDFTMMAQLFPGRTRQDLKKKFKKEEKLNGGQVDKALKSGNLWDVSKLHEDFAAEREAAERAKREAKERLIKEKIADKERQQAARDYRMRESKSSRLLGANAVPARFHKNKGPVSANEIIQDIETLRREKKLKTKTEQTQQEKSATKTVKILQNISITAHHNADITVSVEGIKRNANTEIKTPIGGNTEARTTKGNTSAQTPTHDITAVVPKNIETGSLVVLTVEDPNAPSKKILQTYISNNGTLTPIALPSNLLNSVVGYMNKGTPKSNISVASSPSLTSPNSVSEGRSTPNMVSPTKRKRHSSYTITQL